MIAGADTIKVRSVLTGSRQRRKIKSRAMSQSSYRIMVSELDHAYIHVILHIFSQVPISPPDLIAGQWLSGCRTGETAGSRRIMAG